MKIIREQATIQHYLKEFNINQIVSNPEKIAFQLRHYKRGEIILHEGDSFEGLFFQVDGRTKVTSSVETGKALIYAFVILLRSLVILNLSKRSSSNLR